MTVDDTGWPWGFRQKAAFVFGDSPDGLVMGHYARGSRRIVPIVECPVHADRANRVALTLHAHLAGARVPAAGPALTGVLRHVIVRSTRDGRRNAAMLVVVRNDKQLRAPIRTFLASDDAPDGLFVNVHDRPGPFMVGPETIRIAGRSHVRERVGGLSFLVSPTAFFQTNVEAAEMIVNLVVAAVGDDPSREVLDLYAGSGLFALSLSARGHRVMAVEENRQAMADAQANARLNRCRPENIVLHAARVEEALKRWRGRRFDVVVLDPPRHGCPVSVLRAVFGQVRPVRAVYVSCNPEALSAELPVIVSEGYEVTSVQPVDMFPHTTHIETVVCLDRAPAGRRVSR
jgi:23S rRNA (uracil1939-C5)-methyltransferase